MDTRGLGTEYRDGDVICRQGEPGDRMYVIQSGRVLVCREEGEQEIPVAELAAGKVFGEMSIFDRKPRSATVRAKGPARILTLDKRAFLRGVHEDPSLAYVILQEMSLRVRGLDEEIARLKRQPLRQTAPGGWPLCTVVVPRGEAASGARLAEALSADGRVRVVMDRRAAERRHRREVYQPERRRSERRRRSDLLPVQIAMH